MLTEGDAVLRNDIEKPLEVSALSSNNQKYVQTDAEDKMACPASMWLIFSIKLSIFLDSLPKSTNKKTQKK